MVSSSKPLTCRLLLLKPSDKFRYTNPKKDFFAKLASQDLTLRKWIFSKHLGQKQIHKFVTEVDHLRSFEHEHGKVGDLIIV
jgi:hypothetical protein